MSTARLQSRVEPVTPLGAATLADFAWHCNKRGRDGTGKANVVALPGSTVWGVLFELRRDALTALDRFEGGYRRTEVTVACAGDLHVAATYLSERYTDDPRPTAAYRAFLVAGAREHRLPAAWLRRLESLAIAPAREPGAGR